MVVQRRTGHAARRLFHRSVQWDDQDRDDRHAAHGAWPGSGCASRGSVPHTDRRHSHTADPDERRSVPVHRRLALVGERPGALLGTDQGASPREHAAHLRAERRAVAPGAGTTANRGQHVHDGGRYQPAIRPEGVQTAGDSRDGDVARPESGRGHQLSRAHARLDRRRPRVAGPQRRAAEFPAEDLAQGAAAGAGGADRQPEQQHRIASSRADPPRTEPVDRAAPLALDAVTGVRHRPGAVDQRDRPAPLAGRCPAAAGSRRRAAGRRPPRRRAADAGRGSRGAAAEGQCCSHQDRADRRQSAQGR